MKCHFCGTEVQEEKIFRSSLCGSCGRELKICLNCKFYTPGAHWDCRETIAEAVGDKERANFCDYFSPADFGSAKTDPSSQKEARNARTQFDKLFG
jgi:hypothetical protein